MVTKVTVLSDVPMATHRARAQSYCRGAVRSPRDPWCLPVRLFSLQPSPGSCSGDTFLGWERLHGQLSVLSCPTGCVLYWIPQTPRVRGWSGRSLSLPGSPCPARKDLWFADSRVGTGLGQALRGDGALGTPSPLEQLSPHPWSPALVVPAPHGTRSPWFSAASQGNRFCKLQSLQPPLPFPRLCFSLQPDPP